MAHISTDEIIEWQRAEDLDTYDVLEKRSMTVGLNRYHPGSASNSFERTHSEDELYYIVSGSGKVRIEDDVYAVATGDMIFVEKGVEHTFFDLDEEINALKIFASD